MRVDTIYCQEKCLYECVAGVTSHLMKKIERAEFFRLVMVWPIFAGVCDDGGLNGFRSAIECAGECVVHGP